MAWQLVAEVLDHAPPACGPAERLVLVAIAEAIHTDRRETRRCTTGVADLARRTGLRPASVTDALTRMRDRVGLDVRVAIGTDRRGNPVYATPGRVPIFELPVLQAPVGCPCSACTHAAAGSAITDPRADDGSAVADAGPVGTDPHLARGSVTADTGSALIDPSVCRGSVEADPGSVTTDPGSVSTDPSRVPGHPEERGGSVSADPSPADIAHAVGVFPIAGGRRFDRGEGRRPVYRCDRHAHLPLTADQPCAACREVRELSQAEEQERRDAEQAERTARARSARICPDCAGTGYAPVPGSDNTVTRCKHPRLAGLAAVAS